mmetsp:Transcript_51946/g.96082  ORF Transcript_51946/g.96082 Transcript_51946/m.96082 type:complete len:295 (+) Transcript_51946:28-912(+)
MDVLSPLCRINGLFGILASSLGAVGLCALEAVSVLFREAFLFASSTAEQAAWRLVVSQRGLQVNFLPGADVPDVHRRLKRFYSWLRLVESPANFLWPVAGIEGMDQFQQHLESFLSVCDGWPHKLAMEFAFNPEEVRCLLSPSAQDVSMSRPQPAEARSNSYVHSGNFHSALGIRSLHLRASCQALLNQHLQEEHALFLELRLGKPVPESTWAQVVIWCGEQASANDTRGVLEDDKVDVSTRLKLPSGCTSISITRVAQQTRLLSALTTHGTVRMLLAFQPCSASTTPGRRDNG